MPISQSTKGDLAIISGALLWGLFPVITALSYAGLAPLASLAFSTLFAAAFFGITLTFRRKWRELGDKSVWKDLFYITLFISVGYYCFFFWGLRYTSAGNASILALSETFFSYLLFNVWRKEYFSKTHIAGSLLMLGGAVLVITPQTGGWNKGDLLILLAAAIAPIGSYYQQKVRKKSAVKVLCWAEAC